MKLQRTILIYCTIVIMCILDLVMKFNLGLNLTYDIILKILINRVPKEDFVKLMLHAVLTITLMTGGLFVTKHIINRKQKVVKLLLEVVIVKLFFLLINIILSKICFPNYIMITLNYLSYIIYYFALVYIIFEDRTFLITNLLKSKIIFCSIIIGYLVMKMLNSKWYVNMLFRDNELSLWSAFHQDGAWMLCQSLDIMIGYILLLLLILLFNKKLTDKVKVDG